MAVKYGEPYAVEGGAFDGMKLTHFSALPVEDGKHLVTVLNRAGLAGDVNVTSKAATISTDELQALLKGTTGTVEAYAAKSAAAAAARLAAEKAGTVVVEGAVEKGVVEALDVAKVVTKV
jgi:hypothetical protein